MAKLRTILSICLLLLLPSLVLGGEECSVAGGVCRDVCADDEHAELGAFIDCAEKQECCVKNDEQRSRDILQPGDSVRKDEE